MLFTSLPFIVFIVVVLVLYWAAAAKGYKVQNLLLLLANYVFYAWWSWQFLLLLIVYGLAIYGIGGKIYAAQNERSKRAWLAVGLVAGISTLCYFKYTNFFITSFSELLSEIGMNSSLHTLDIIMPLGISFFTFQMLGYVLDIKNGKVKPTTDVVAFLAFASFFPTLLSGPIERADNLLVQLQQNRVFNSGEAKDGLRQILWGLFKKVVVADNCARVVDAIFNNYHTASSWSLLAGMLIYPVQLYADFSGYSDMAIGIARLMGFNLVRNFAYPFFARNIPEYWRRWHMSLTSWLTEYLYTPLTISFRYSGVWGMLLSIFITYTIIGFWHGANWTFIVFGLIHSVYFSIFLLQKKTKKKIKGESDLSAREVALMMKTYAMVAFAELFFRASSVQEAWGYLRRIFSVSALHNDLAAYANYTLLLIPCMLAIEWRGRHHQHALVMHHKPAMPVRWAIYTILILFIFFCGGTQQKFIYLQF